MGAWGMAPADSDYAQDLWGDCTDATRQRIAELYGVRMARPSRRRWPAPATAVRRDATRGDEYAISARVGAVQEALQAGLWLPAAVVASAAKECRALAARREWLREWRDPKATRRALLLWARRLEALLPRPRRDYKQRLVPNCYPWRGWPMRRARLRKPF